MKTHKTNPRLEIWSKGGWFSTVDRQMEQAMLDLKELERHLNEHAMLVGFESQVQCDYEYECEICGYTHTERERIRKCACGADVCNNCGYLSEDDTQWLCEKCFKAQYKED